MKVRCEVNRIALQKAVEHLLALEVIDQPWHPGVFGGDLRVVLGKALWAGTQNGKVYVDQQLGIGLGGCLGRCRSVAGGDYEGVLTLSGFIRCTAFFERLHSPLSAAQFVVFGFDVVDGIVKPQRNCHFAGALGLLPDCIQVRQAFGQMLLGVIVALRLGIGGQQALLKIGGWRQIEGGPAALP